MEQLLNDFSVGLFAMQALILLILIVLMKKFAWKPILGALDAREGEIKDAIDAAKKAKEELVQVTSDKESLLTEAKAERDNILAEAQSTAKSIVAEAKEAASAEGTKMIEKAKQSIEQEKKAALADIKNQASTLSIEIAEKLLRAELKNKAAQEEVLSQYVKEAASLN